MSVSSGDTAWILISSALVMLMTPGVALFYGGMVRRKNVLSTLMMSFAALGLVGLLWILYGYSLSLGSDIGGLIGRLDFIGLRQVGQEPSSVYASTVPHLAFMVFQMNRHIDESLDVWAVHGMGGTWGALATGIFASAAVNSAGADGLLLGNWLQLGKQFVGVAAVWVFAFVATMILGKLIDITIGLRISGMEETVGLDISQHGERAYGGVLR